MTLSDTETNGSLDLGTPDIDTSILSQTAQQKFAALERRLRSYLEATFNDQVTREVHRHIEEYLLPHYKEKLEKAEMLMKIGKPFSNAEFRIMLRALHPDSTDQSHRRAAFDLLMQKEVVLRPEEKDRPLTSTLPTTIAELLAMKKTKR
jgi:hypothetical protein